MYCKHWQKSKTVETYMYLNPKIKSQRVSIGLIFIPTIYCHSCANIENGGKKKINQAMAKYRPSLNVFFEEQIKEQATWR